MRWARVLARSARSSGPVGGLRLTHSIVRFVGRRGLYLLVDHVGYMYLCMLELVRALLDILMQLQFCGDGSLEEAE